MNFLGHAIFADGPDDLLFGAVTADLFKRQPTDHLSQEIQDGFKVHQVLDSFSGKLNQFKFSRSKIHAMVDHYSDPIFDICCDHIIASHWNGFFNTSLDEFAHEVNQIVTDRVELIPRLSAERVEKMLSENWLVNYQSEKGLSAGITRFAGRAKGDNGQKIIDSLDRIIDVTEEISEDVCDAVQWVRFHNNIVMRTIGYEPGQRLQWRQEISLAPECQGFRGKEY